VGLAHEPTAALAHRASDAAQPVYVRAYGWPSKFESGEFETAGSSHSPQGVGDEVAGGFLLLVGKSVRKTSLDRYTTYSREHDVEAQHLTPSFT